MFLNGFLLARQNKWVALRPTRFRVFLVHAFDDMTLIERIRKEFRNYPSIRILIAERRRRPGEILADKIMSMIDGCHLVLVVWSHNLIESITAHHEIGYAMGLNKTIFPFVIEGISLEGFLEGTERIDFNPYDPTQGIRELIKEVRKHALALQYDV